MNSALLILCLVHISFAHNHNPDENAGSTDPNLFEGDMVLTRADRVALIGSNAGSSRGKRAARRDRKWTNAVVYYEIRNDLRGTSAEGVIASAMKEWESKTCIRFQTRTDQTNYVYFYKGPWCSSHVGMQGGSQFISLASGCWIHGVVAHEIGHALGFHHEQSRPDRDNHVIVETANIKEDEKYNFKKYKREEINSMGTAYDYGSLMHYGSHYFSKNGKATIVPRIRGAKIGNREYVSDLDAYQMSVRYNCPAYTAEFGCSYKASAFGWRCWKYCRTRGSGDWCWIDKACSGKPDCGTNMAVMEAQCYGSCG